jgi:CRP-like cAMP-binding protein
VSLDFAPPYPSSNHILGNLSCAYCEAHLFPHLEPYVLEPGAVLLEVGQPSEYVFFPCNGLVSLVVFAGDGHKVEIGMIGAEGVVGAGECLASAKTVIRAGVQFAGQGWQLSGARFRDAFHNSEPLRDAVLRFQYTVAAQKAQCALCNRRHNIDQRLSRWLLMAHDRMQDDALKLTHAIMAVTMGAGRPIVSIAANKLRDAGLIGYTRGTVTILDRAGLEHAACACYSPLREQFEQLLRPV